MRTITQKNIQIWIKQTCYQRPYCVFQENTSTDTYLNNKNKLTSSQTIFLIKKQRSLPSHQSCCIPSGQVVNREGSATVAVCQESANR